ncbi:hypothetical protein D3C81_1857670 [compost metagenome]
MHRTQPLNLTDGNPFLFHQSMLHRGNFLNGYVSYGLREPGLDLIYALPLVQLLDNLLEHILTLGLPCNLCLPIVNKLAHDDSPPL